MFPPLQAKLRHFGKQTITLIPLSYLGGKRLRQREAKIPQEVEDRSACWYSKNKLVIVAWPADTVCLCNHQAVGAAAVLTEAVKVL